MKSLRVALNLTQKLWRTLEAGEGEYVGADPEDTDEYKAENVFFVPEVARWPYLQSKARQPDIGHSFRM